MRLDELRIKSALCTPARAQKIPGGAPMSLDEQSREQILADNFSSGNGKNSSADPDHGKSRPLLLRAIRRVGRSSWYIFKNMLFLAFILAAVVVLLLGLDKVAEWTLKKSPLADVYPQDFTMVKRDLTSPVSHYDYDLTPGICIMHNQWKGNRFEYTNNMGFRDPRPITVEKSDDEFRIFLTGGSTAFGLGASGQAAQATNFYYLEHRETIAHVLERILNASAPIPGKKIRVFNTAVWGYSYQHLLFRYVTKLRRLKPDLVVSLDGANELHPISVPEKDWSYFRQGQFNGILREIFSYNRPGLGAYATLWLKNNTFLMAFLWRGMDPFFTMETGMRMHQTAALGKDSAPGTRRMSQEERSRMVTNNVAAVVRVLEDYHSVLDNDGVPHIFALQPLLYLSKKPRHEGEQKVESIEEHKQYYDLSTDSLYKYISERITDSAHRRHFFLVDFTQYFDDTSEWVFTDWCHLTAGANYLIARELANIIKQHFFKITLTDGDRVESKDTFFWNPILSADVIYAPPSDKEENGTKNLLSGYPGPGLYSSRQLNAEDRSEIVLDLTRTFSLSRMRLVWDDDSVPAEWSVDVSLDGENWTQWVQGTDKEIDSFSWWPGYEYYGAEPTQARFLRYRPTKTQDRSIRLRSWSVQR